MLLFDQAKYQDSEEIVRELLPWYIDKLGADASHTLACKLCLAEALKAQNRFREAETPLKEVLARAAAKEPPDQAIIFACKHSLAGLFERQGKYAEAEPLFREALDGLSSSVGNDHPHTLVGKNGLAWILHCQRKYDEAERLYKEAIAVQSIKQPDHPYILTSKQNLADLYRDQGKFDQAEPILKEVLAARIVKLPPDHPHTLATRLSLGMVYYHTKRYGESVPLIEELLRIRQKNPGDDPPETFVVAFELAVNYRDVNRRNDALVLIKEWLPRARAKYGLRHPKTQRGVEVAMSLYGPPTTTAAEAEAFHKELLQAQIDELGPYHCNTLETKSVLGVRYWREKRYQDSVPLFEDLLKAFRNKIGEEAPETFRTAFNLAMNYCDAGRPLDAIALINHWLPRSRHKLNLDDPIMKFGIDAALYIFDCAKRPDMAELLLRDLAEAWKNKAGDESSKHATQLGLLALNLVNQKKPTEAEPVLRECLAIRLKIEPERWVTYSIQSMLGEALLDQQKYAEAEPMLVQGHEGLQKRESKIPNEGAFVLTKSLERLVRLYESWGKKAQAVEWQNKLNARTEAMKKQAPPKDK
jgi:tetratricopeptide (TPR) repeat protein